LGFDRQHNAGSLTKFPNYYNCC